MWRGKKEKKLENTLGWSSSGNNHKFIWDGLISCKSKRSSEFFLAKGNNYYVENKYINQAILVKTGTAVLFHTQHAFVTGHNYELITNILAGHAKNV